MKIIEEALNGVLLLEPTVFPDDRGYFYESYNKEQAEKLGITLDFVQDNQSLSAAGVIRGLHFQNPPYEQGKLVRVLQGAVIDVAVDIRKGSPTYGQSFSAKLTAENKRLLWVPPGFAHGFSTLEDETIFLYKCTNGYNKASEGSIKWNDPDLNIDWQVSSAKLSDKDAVGSSLKEFDSAFTF